METMADTKYSNCDTLVLVCGHAHFRSDLAATSPLDPLAESSWILKPFQASGHFSSLNGSHPKQGEHQTFCAHILAGLRALQNPHAFLVFSGGVTDKSFPYSEAESYRDAMLALIKQGGTAISEAMLDGQRWALEDKATDSFQNLMFSVVKFRQVTGRWPERITVVTHEFKRARFLECHAEAIRWPKRRIEVEGIDPVWSCPEELQMAQAMEVRHAFGPFQKDPYGVLPPLSTKKVDRGWKPEVLDELADGLDNSVWNLLRWDQTELFGQALPWSS